MTLFQLQQNYIDSPEEKLGPNYEAVFNFWSFVTDLSSEEEKLIERRYVEFEGTNNNYAIRLIEYTNKVLTNENEADIWEDVFAAPENLSHTGRLAIAWATHELICMHKLIEDGEHIVVLPLFDCAIGETGTPALQPF
jgi:hypothetical protein